MATHAQRSAQVPPSAHPWRRLMGIFYEIVILFGVLWLADYVFSSLTSYKGEAGTMRVIFQIFQVLVLGSYFIGFWSYGRRTLPMKTMELQLLDTQGHVLTPTRAALRFAIGAGLIFLGLAMTLIHPAAILAIGLPASWALVDQDRRALYDILAGTRLVTLSPATSPAAPQSSPTSSKAGNNRSSDSHNADRV